MEAVQPRPSGGLKKLLSTRKGAWIVAVLTAALAGLALMLFVNRYKESVRQGLASRPILTADRLIPEGTAGNVVITERMFKPTAVAEEDARPGAVADADALLGKGATRDILPGQQITAADFSQAADPLRSRLAKTDRLVQVPIDGSHGLLGTIKRGDRVDVMVSFTGNSRGASAGAAGRPAVRYLLRDVRVAGAPPAAQSGGAAVGSGSVLLETTDRQAAQLAFVSDNAKLWFVLRPPVGAVNGKAPTVTAEAVRAGSDSLTVTAKVKPDGEGGGTVTLKARPGR